MIIWPRCRLLLIAAALLGAGQAAYSLPSLINILGGEGVIGRESAVSGALILLRNHLPDFAWSLAMPIVFLAIWWRDRIAVPLSAGLGLAVALGHEVSQAFRPGGTFDWLDVLAAVAACGVFVMCFKGGSGGCRS